jgi:hypothetical protein
LNHYNLASLNMKDSKERWHKSICDPDLLYFASAAPLVVGNHVIAGGGMSNGPISYELDGTHVVVGAGDTLFAFATYGR